MATDSKCPQREHRTACRYGDPCLFFVNPGSDLHQLRAASAQRNLAKQPTRGPPVTVDIPIDQYLGAPPRSAPGIASRALVFTRRLPRYAQALDVSHISRPSTARDFVAQSPATSAFLPLDYVCTNSSQAAFRLPMSTTDFPLTLDELTSLPLFRGESRIALEWLLSYCRLEQVAADTVILSPERNNDDLYIPLSGYLRVQLDGEGQKILDYIEPGHGVGEMSIIEGVPPSALVVAHTDCRMLIVNGDALRTLIEQSHVLARNLLHVLSSRLRHDNLVIVKSIQQQTIYEQHSNADGLTGLHNRRWMNQALPALWRNSCANGTPLALMMIDVDYFKRFNDTHGHPAGDRALAGIADCLRSQLRAVDAAIRYGGEEFLILMPDTDIGSARNIAERLRGVIAAHELTDADGRTLPSVTVSIGIAALSAGQSHEDLLRTADAALYEAKHDGRNCVRP